MSVSEVEGFVLAGGQSTRFGSDKALAQYRGRTLIDYALGSLRDLDLTPRIVARDYGGYGSLARVFVVAERPDRGPAEGLRAALTACSTPWALVLGVDMPGVNAEALRVLLAGRHAGVEAVCFERDQRRHPLPGVYARTLLRLWENEPGPRSLHAVLDVAAVNAPAPPNAATVVNVNRPETLE